MSDMQTRWNIWEFGLFTFNKSILGWELHINKYLAKRQEAQILRPVTLKLTTENYCTKMKKMRSDAGKTFNKSILWWELHNNKYLPKRQEAQILRPVTLKLTTENYCTKVKKCEVMQAKRTFRNEKLYETFFEESKGHFEIHCWAST